MAATSKPIRKRIKKLATESRKAVKHRAPSVNLLSKKLSMEGKTPKQKKIIKSEY